MSSSISHQLQAAARALQDKTLLYYPSNVHFTEAGNRVVAEGLAPVITGHTLNDSFRRAASYVDKIFERRKACKSPC